VQNGDFKLKKFLFFFVAVGVGLPCFVFYRTLSFPPTIPVQLSKSDTPILHVDIQGQSKPLYLALVSKHSLFLHQESIDSMSAKYLGHTSWTTSQGDTQNSQLYCLDKLKIGKLRLKAPIDLAIVDQGEKETFCWPFNTRNLLIDLPLRRLGSPKTEKDLKRLGYDISEFSAFPCTVNSGYISIDLETDQGTKTFMLSTRTSANLINSKTCAKTAFIKDKFHHLDRLPLIPFEASFPEGIDGVLGIDFFRNRPLYFDVKKRKIYLGLDRARRVVQKKLQAIPVKFSDAGDPLIDVTIDGRSIPLIIDTGSDFPLNIHEEMISTFKFPYLYDSTCTNFRGEGYSAPNYLLECLKIGNTKFYNVRAHTQIEGFSGVDITTPLVNNYGFKGVGTIGRPIFSRTNLLCDFPNGQIFLGNPGLDLSSWEKIPSTNKTGHITITVNTQLGPLNMIVDTGATLSIIDKKIMGSKEVVESKLSIATLDFDEVQFHALDLSKLDRSIDGILGMNFLVAHPFFIDFEERAISFKKGGGAGGSPSFPL